jgi:hypothetical protein
VQLATVEAVKTALGIGDSTQDSLLGQMINRISARIAEYLGYPPARAVYTADTYAINQNQLLYLRTAAIQAVSQVTIQGVTVTAGGDAGYQLSFDDAKAGRLYRGIGWCGRYFTRDMTYDPVAGARDISIDYTAGWYLPGDASFVDGNPASLPFALQDGTIQAVSELYRVNQLGAEGFVMYSEGGLKTMLEQKAAPGAGISGFNDGSGLSEVVKGIVNPWKRWVVA